MPVWQSIYEELRDQGLEILSAAQDSEGERVAGPIFDAAQASFTSVVDVAHSVSAAFGLTNVPSAVWIDESGRIVRIDAGAYPVRRQVLGRQLGIEGYREALRDWVRKGDDSIFALPPEEITAALPDPSADAAQAEVEFRLGAYFYGIGDADRATSYWERAQSLAPDNWNYHRQEWVDSRFESGLMFLGRVLLRAARGIPYYEPVELPRQPDVPSDAGGEVDSAQPSETTPEPSPPTPESE